MLRGPADPSVHHRRTALGGPLESFIAHLWEVEWDRRGQPPLVVETLPHPAVHLVFEGHRLEVAGVARRRFTRTLEGQGRVFGIKFRPAMFRGLLTGPVSQLANRVVPVHTLLGRRSAQVARAIVGESSPTARHAIAKAWLETLCGEPLALAVSLRDLVERAEVNRAWVKVEQLAAAAHVSGRTLQRHFGEFVGASPKWVLQRYRLHEANERLKQAPQTPLADLALELGYVDQSHFVRDFKALVGVAPGAYVKAL